MRSVWATSALWVECLCLESPHHPQVAHPKCCSRLYDTLHAILTHGILASSFSSYFSAEPIMLTLSYMLSCLVNHFMYVCMCCPPLRELVYCCRIMLRLFCSVLLPCTLIMGNCHFHRSLIEYSRME